MDTRSHRKKLLKLHLKTMIEARNHGGASWQEDGSGHLFSGIKTAFCDRFLDQHVDTSLVQTPKLRFEDSLWCFEPVNTNCYVVALFLIYCYWFVSMFGILLLFEMNEMSDFTRTYFKKKWNFKHKNISNLSQHFPSLRTTYYMVKNDQQIWAGVDSSLFQSKHELKS